MSGLKKNDSILNERERAVVVAIGAREVQSHEDASLQPIEEEEEEEEVAIGLI